MQTTLARPLSPNAQKTIALGMFVALFVLLVAAASVWTIPIGVDWKGAFRPAALLMLSGQNPFAVGGYHNPPWALIPLIPIALLPEQLGAAVVLVLNFFAYGFIAYRLKAKPLPLVLFLLSPVVIFCGSTGNIDWLAALGFLMPPQIGLFFVLMKPQIGAVLAVFWLVEAWRKGGRLQVFRTFAPVTIVFMLSLILYGFWPLQMAGMPNDLYNRSMWPLSIPVGLVLLVYALRTRKAGLSLTAAPFLSPYVNIHSYAPALLGLGVNSIEFALVCVALWVMKFAGLY